MTDCHRCLIDYERVPVLAGPKSFAPPTPRAFHPPRLRSAACVIDDPQRPMKPTLRPLDRGPHR
jgi:hypothetical protein